MTFIASLYLTDISLVEIIYFSCLCVLNVKGVMCLHGSRLKKKHYFPHTVHYCCSAFLKCADLYKAHHSEKWGVLWLASYPVFCDWLNTSRMWQKCYAPYHVVMLCPRATRPLYSVHITAIHSVTTQSLVIMFFFFWCRFLSKLCYILLAHGQAVLCHSCFTVTVWLLNGMLMLVYMFCL